MKRPARGWSSQAMARGRYAAHIEGLPPESELPQRLVEESWQVWCSPEVALVAKAFGAETTYADARAELDRLLGDASDVRILGDSHAVVPDVVGAQGTPMMETLIATSPPSELPILSWPGLVTPTSSPTPTKDEQPKDEAAAAVPAAHAATADDRAELVKEGLRALEVPRRLWEHIESDDLKAFAKETSAALYAARIAYASRVGWILAPELELLADLERRKNEPESLEKFRTRQLLSARINLIAEEAESARQDVELKKELVRQQHVVGDILDEYRMHAYTWRTFAGVGKWFLISLTAFVTLVTGFLAFLLYDGKLAAWAFPAAVFVLAVFAISPAVLLIIER